MRPCWTHLLALARDEVRQTLASLPDAVRAPATALPVCYERLPGPAILADGFEPDLLGLFVGAPVDAPESSPLPPQIILFLENIWDLAGRDDEIFRAEVQTTYLHELGHFLGLDEIDLEERGLD